MAFKWTGGGVDITTRLSFYKENDRSVVTVQGQAAIVDLDVKDRAGEGLFTLPRLAITVLPSVVTDNRLHIGEVQVQSPILSVIRQADGAINLSGLVTSGEASTTGDENTLSANTETVDELEQAGQTSPQADVAESEQAPETVAQDQPAEVAEPDQPAVAVSSEEDAGDSFVVEVDRFVLAGGTVRFVDYAVTGPETGPVENTVNDLSVTVAPFSTAPGKQSLFDVGAAINNTAPVSVKGDMTVSPLAVESDIRLSDVALAWGQPYLPENMHLKINGGRAVTSGHFSMETTEDGQVAATVTGNAAVSGFASADPEKDESFLQWSDFTVDGIDVSTAPLCVKVATIVFKDIKQQVAVFEDGVTNIAKVFGQAETSGEPAEKNPQPAPGKAATPDGAETVTPVSIGRFLMENTEIRFTDRSMVPHYATRLTLTDLKVTGLTSEDFKAATVKASGNIDGYAPALEKLGQKGESPDSETLATAILPAGQYDRTLRRIYEKEVEEKPIEGVVVKKADDPALSIEEMETAIVERRAGAVTDGELGLLAKQRAEKVKDYLLSDENLSPERVFMKAPGNIFKTADGEFAASRVELGVQ